MFLMWQDGKSSLDARIEAGRAAYAKRFGLEATLILIHPATLAQDHTALPSVTLRATTTVPRDVLFVGRTEGQHEGA